MVPDDDPAVSGISQEHDPEKQGVVQSLVADTTADSRGKTIKKE